MSANTIFIVTVQKLITEQVEISAVTETEAEYEAACLPWVARVVSVESKNFDQENEESA